MLYHLTRNWGWVLASGICRIVFGVVAFVWPQLTLNVLLSLLGAYLLVDGAISIIRALINRSSDSFPWSILLLGLVSLLAGVVTMFWPGWTAMALLYLVAAWAIVAGVIEIVIAIQLRQELSNEWLLLALGALSVLFGLLLVIWPSPGILALIWMLALWAVAFGVVEILLALRLRALRNKLGQRLAGTPL